MKLTISEVKALAAFLEGNTNIASLQQALQVRQPRVSYLAERLVEKGFLAKMRQGLKLELELASTPYALKFREMYAQHPHRPYAEILSGRNLDVLQAIAYKPKETKTIARMLGVQPRAIREKLARLSDFALIHKTGKRYALSPSAKEMYGFIDSLRTYMDLNGVLQWRLNDEILYATRDEGAVQGHLTGFNEYHRYGVEVNTARYLCYTGEKPPIEELFVHSLFQIEDSRTLGLAVTFLARNRLQSKEVAYLAEKYDVTEKLHGVVEVYNRFQKMDKTVPTGEKRVIEVEGVPRIEMQVLRKQFELYGVV